MATSDTSSKRWFVIGLEAIAIASSLIVLIALLYLVISRYWTVFPDSGMHTISLIAAMWLYMTGALLASYRREHLRVDFISYKLTNKTLKLCHQLLVSVITLFITILFLYWTYKMFSWGARFSTTMPGSNIPIWVPQLAIGMNAIGSVCFSLRDLVLIISAYRTQGS